MSKKKPDSERGTNPGPVSGQRASLRLASGDEASALSDLALRSKAHWGYSSQFLEDCRAELAVTPDGIAKPTLTYVVAECFGVIVGFYALEKLSNEEVELDALFVEPESIGKGVGRLLMENAKLRAREMGGKVLRIQSDPGTVPFYLAAGGTVVGSVPSGSIAGRELPVLEVSLLEVPLKAKGIHGYRLD